MLSFSLYALAHIACLDSILINHNLVRKQLSMPAWCSSCCWLLLALFLRHRPVSQACAHRCECQETLLCNYCVINTQESVGARPRARYSRFR